MRSSRALFVVLSVSFAASAHAARVDMTDPKRALGRQDDVRVDAQLVRETVSAGSPLGVTYQIENLTTAPIALADKVSSLSYDAETRVLTMSIGSEIPAGGVLPHLVTLGPGQKKTMTAASVLHLALPASRSPLVAVPRLVEIHVNFLRETESFQPLIERQAAGHQPIVLTDQQFDLWLRSSDTVVLNAIPIQFGASPGGGEVDASRGAAGGRGFRETFGSH